MQEVEETVMMGSVYEALYAEFISLEDIMNYLDKRKSKNDKEEKKLCVAFRILCLFEAELPKKAFKKHLLRIKNPNFLYIYAFTNKKPVSEVLRKIQSVSPPEDMIFLKSICDEIFNFNKENAEHICAVRNLKHTSLYTFNDILRTDFLILFEGKDGKHYYNNLIGRCLYLSENAPLYWEHVGVPLYRNFILKKFPNPIFKRVELEILSECFPSLYDEKIMKRPDVINYLSNATRHEAAYHLGFPIHEYIPNQKKIDQALSLLSEIGVDKYLEKRDVREHDDKIHIANAENVHCDNIDDFNSFDVVYYYTDDDNTDLRHLFRFTRPEFATILKDKKNFYTGELLPDFILSEIRCRLQIASMYNLPAAKVLKELLNREDENEAGEIGEIDQNEDGDDEMEDMEDIEDEMEDMELEDEDGDFYICKVKKRNGDESIVRVTLTEELQELDEEELHDFLRESFARDGLQYLGPVSCDCNHCGVSLNDRARLRDD